MSHLRPELGDFNSIVCFKAVVVGMEQALGEKVAMVGLLAAGRLRGREVAKSLAIPPEKAQDAEFLRSALDSAIGKNGTRLCIIDKIEMEDRKIRVSVSETVCSAGEPQGSPRVLSFTMGAIQGAIEALTGRSLKGVQTASVLRGGTHDVIEFGDRI
jgi:predicted hydrocarbon binding protein